MSLPRFKGVCRECGHDSTKDWPNNKSLYTREQIVKQIMECEDLHLIRRDHEGSWIDATPADVLALLRRE